MARGIHLLTPGRAKQLSRDPGMHCDGGGLYLCVTPPSASSWVYRFMLRGTRREMGLGAYPELSLDTARALAADARSKAKSGLDPLKERESQRASQSLEKARAITFQQCAAEYIAAQSGKWRSAKHEAQWSSTLAAHVYPKIGDLPVATVDRQLVIRVLEPIWKTIPDTATKVRGRMEAILAYAGVRDYRTGPNPAQWRGVLDKVFPTRTQIRPTVHFAALPFKKLPAFVAKLEEEEGDVANALMFTILTAARTGEVIGAQWSEIDLEEGIWTVPGKRMKTGREHRVPLSRHAVAVLRKQHKATGGTGYVFKGRNLKKGLSNMTMLKLLKERMGYANLTVHGFRSCFRDWAEEETAFPRSVTEAALAHTVGDKVEAAYRRGDLFDKRRKLMEAWTRFCTTPVAAGNVIPLKRAAK